MITHMCIGARPGIFLNQPESEKEFQQRCVVYFGSFWLNIYTDIIPNKDVCLLLFIKWGWIAVSTNNSNNQLFLCDSTKKINVLVRRR